MTVQTPTDPTPSIAPATAIGRVHLTVADLERSRRVLRASCSD